MKKSRFYYTRPPMLIQAYVNTIEEHIVPTNKVIKKWPQYTICGTLDYETNVLSVGVACCSPKDNFNKKIARRISEGRAAKKPIITIEVTKENVSNTFITIAQQIEREVYGLDE